MKSIFAAVLRAALCAHLLACAAGASAWAAPSSAQDAHPADMEFIEYTGAANVRHTQTLVYREHHVLGFRGGRLSERMVLYTCPNGSVFARKKVTYVDSQAPDFFLDDASNGIQEGIRSEGGKRTVFFRAGRLEPEKSAPLPHVAHLVADAGFDDFIHTHWDALMSGTSLPLHFLVPSRLRAMNFDVQHVRSEGVDGKPAEVFSLNLTGFLGWVVPGIDVTYDAAQHVLVRYEGISDLRDARGDNLKVTIVFHLSDRRPSSAQAFAKAEQASIAPCH